MTKVLSRGEKIRNFILKHVEKHPADISTFTSNHFDVTRQAINRHLQRLIKEKALTVTGKTKDRVYKLCPLIEYRKDYQISDNLAEDVVWREDIASILGEMPDNIKDIWHHGFTEMFNNAIDHSEGDIISVRIKTTAIATEIIIYDNGIGIFKKIQKALNLLDERHAVLELSKGKFTTDPKNHSGEGIFFSSRMFDSFDIFSGGVYYSHIFGESEDWILERDNSESYTSVWMKLNNHSSRSIKKIFNEFSTDDNYMFDKTVVPVILAKYGNENLVSRSQAKRLLARIEKFKVVIFDFKNINNIGQAFADEIFRVFQNRHPEIEMITHKANNEIESMINRVKSSDI